MNEEIARLRERVAKLEQLLSQQANDITRLQKAVLKGFETADRNFKRLRNRSDSSLFGDWL